MFKLGALAKTLEAGETGGEEGRWKPRPTPRRSSLVPAAITAAGVAGLGAGAYAFRKPIGKFLTKHNWQGAGEAVEESADDLADQVKSLTKSNKLLQANIKRMKTARAARKAKAAAPKAPDVVKTASMLIEGLRKMSAAVAGTQPRVVAPTAMGGLPPAPPPAPLPQFGSVPMSTAPAAPKPAAVGLKPPKASVPAKAPMAPGTKGLVTPGSKGLVAGATNTNKGILRGGLKALSVVK